MAREVHITSNIRLLFDLIYIPVQKTLVLIAEESLYLCCKFENVELNGVIFEFIKGSQFSSETSKPSDL